jgi:hypothetical protein
MFTQHHNRAGDVAGLNFRAHQGRDLRQRRGCRGARAGAGAQEQEAESGEAPERQAARAAAAESPVPP